MWSLLLLVDVKNKISWLISKGKRKKGENDLLEKFVDRIHIIFVQLISPFYL